MQSFFKDLFPLPRLAIAIIIAIIIYGIYAVFGELKNTEKAKKEIEYSGIISDIKPGSLGFKDVFIQEKKGYIYFNDAISRPDTFWQFTSAGDSIIKNKGEDSILIIKQHTSERRRFLYTFYPR